VVSSVIDKLVGMKLVFRPQFVQCCRTKMPCYAVMGSFSTSFLAPSPIPMQPGKSIAQRSHVEDISSPTTVQACRVVLPHSQCTPPVFPQAWYMSGQPSATELLHADQLHALSNVAPCHVALELVKRCAAVASWLNVVHESFLHPAHSPKTEPLLPTRSITSSASSASAATLVVSK